MCLFNFPAMKILSLILLIIFTDPLFGQDMNRVRQHIDTLASPSMHGRGYQQGGDKIAAGYIHQKFQKTGLLSFKDASPLNYYQEFGFKVNLFHSVDFSVDDTRLEFGKDYLVHPASNSGKGCSGKLLYLDSAVFYDGKYRKKFLKLDLSDKVLVFPSSYAKRIFSMPPAVMSQIFQASCLVELIEGKLTFSVATSQLPAPYFQVKKLFLDNKKVKKISFETAAHLKDYHSQNVIGFLPGKSKRDSFVVFSAHYDHLGRVGDAYFPGANDNASGVSMLLELASYYALPENAPEYSIVFMAFGAEEAGLIGSGFYVNNPLFPLKSIKFLINLDLLGTGEEGITVVNATKFPEQFNKLNAINNQKNYLAAVRQRGPAANSDHYFFTEKGVPSFFIYTMGGIAAYHDIYDRAETLPLTKYPEVFLLLTDFVREL